MQDAVINQIANLLSEFFKAINNLYKTGVLEDLRKIISEIIRKLCKEGLYQALEYESILELMDAKGLKARFCKREKIRYLQDNTIAFQDQAWGDGKILVDYDCSPGFPADRYRSGNKTFVLISLRGVKNRGDIDEFSIKWKILKGFLKKNGYWGTEISHDTVHVKSQIIFPKARPPKRVGILEKNRQRTYGLDRESFRQLPDERWVVTWEKNKPDLYEQYVMNWEW